MNRKEERQYTLDRLSVPKIDLSLVPEPYLSWAKSKPDIIRGTWSFKELAHRDVKRERIAIEKYFMLMDRRFPEYMNFLTHILTHPETNTDESGIAGMTRLGRRSISAMENECRLSVIIPSRDEERNIYRTLSSYERQLNKEGKLIDPKKWEINIVVNKKEGEQHDGTYNEILRFKRDFPHVRINALEITLEKSWACIGFLRKLLSDMSLIRSYLRSDQLNPHYIESDDADLVWVDPHLVHTVISTFDMNPQLDSLTGYQEKDLRAMAEIEHIFLSRRFWDIMTAQAFKLIHDGKISPGNRDFIWSRPFTYGVNTAHTSEAHALIGGYDWEIKVGEDLDIGKRISLLRGTIQNGLFIPDVRSLGLMRTRTNSNPRRYVWALYRNINHPYANGNFEKDEVRKLSEDEMIQNIPQPYKRITEENKRFYEKELWFLYENLRNMVPNERLAKLIASRTMYLIGFKVGDYNVTEDEIKIHNVENFSKALADFRRRKPY